MSKVPQKINDILYEFCLMDVDAKRPGDTCGQGGRKLAKSCGRLLWMTP